MTGVDKEVYPLYTELKEKYLSGSIELLDKDPVTDKDNWVVYFISEERREAGTKYLTWAPVKEFKAWVELDDDLSKQELELLTNIMWGTGPNKIN